MAETDAAAPAAAAPKKAKSSKPKKPKTAPSHPKVSEMVNAAILDLKEKGGSSLQAIKKHISSHHKVDIERLAPFIKKYLKGAVVSGAIVQTKGKGASGSFKVNGPKGDKKKKPAVAKAAKPKKAKSAVKKPKAKAGPKKAKAAKPKSAKPKKPKAKKAAKAKK